MKKVFLFPLFVLSLSAALAQSLEADKQKAILNLDAQMDHYGAIAHEIWGWAELGFQEQHSTALLQKTLADAGFRIEQGVAGMPTSFIASYGSGKPVIGFLAEFDALADMAQQAVPEQSPIAGQAAGHACGHHLFGTGSVAAAIQVKEWLQRTGTSGTIRLYGTPAEEGGGGKVFMVREGLFNDVDAVLTWHPSSQNAANASATLAAVGMKFRFHGTAAHAAAGPWRGHSALDGVESMDVMVNMLREHITPESRIHYAITNGAKAPNIVPAEAEVYYIIRHPDMNELRDMIQRVIRCAEGAAMGTDTKVDYEYINGYFNVMPNQTLASLMHDNLEQVGGVSYNADEKAFAMEIMKTYPSDKLTPESAMEIAPFKVVEKGGYASTDVGDISWVVPTASMGAATWAPGTIAHSWQAVAAGGTTIGTKGMLVAAKTLTLSAMDLFAHPARLQDAKNELEERRGSDFTYESLIGDRNPPLDYMKFNNN